MHVNAANMTPEVITNDSDVAAIDLDVFDATVQVNLRGALLCARHAVPALLASGGGALVRHVASRWGREGIRANAVAPGPVPSEAVLPYFDEAMLDGMRAALHSP